MHAFSRRVNVSSFVMTLIYGKNIILFYVQEREMEKQSEEENIHKSKLNKTIL